jgi:hypothetical protein
VVADGGYKFAWRKGKKREESFDLPYIPVDRQHQDTRGVVFGPNSVGVTTSESMRRYVLR